MLTSGLNIYSDVISTLYLITISNIFYWSLSPHPTKEFKFIKVVTICLKAYFFIFKR